MRSAVGGLYRFITTVNRPAGPNALKHLDLSILDVVGDPFQFPHQEGALSLYSGQVPGLDARDSVRPPAALPS